MLKLPVAAWLAVVLLIAAGLIGAIATAGGDDGGSSREEEPEASEPSDDDESEVSTGTTPAPEPAETTAPTTPPTSPVTTVEVTEPSTTAAPTTTAVTEPPTTPQPTGPTGEADSPLPVGDPVLSAFTYEEEFGDAKWDGYIAGLIETGRGQFSSEGAGRCVVAIGALTPTETTGEISSGFSTPTVSLIVNGRLLDSTVSECDTSKLAAQGYGWILDAEITVGTEYPFHAEFLLPGNEARQPEALVIGSATSEDAIYFEPTVLEAIPPTGAEPGSMSDRELRPTGDPRRSTFRYDEPFGDAKWEGFIAGIVETGRDQSAEGPGRCVVVIGTVTPTVATGAVSDAFSAPTIGLIADGRLVDSAVGECDTSGLEANGYGWILDAEVTIGTEYAFFEAFLVPGEAPATPQAIAVGYATDADAIYFEATILDTIPQA